MSTYQHNTYFVCNSESSSYVPYPDDSEASHVVAEGMKLKELSIIDHLRETYESDRFIGMGVLEFIPGTIQGRLYFNRAINGLEAS